MATEPPAGVVGGEGAAPQCRQGVPSALSLPQEPGCIQSWRGSAQRCWGVRVCREQGYPFQFELQRCDFPYSKKIKVMEEDLIWQEGCYSFQRRF